MTECDSRGRGGGIGQWDVHKNMQKCMQKNHIFFLPREGFCLITDNLITDNTKQNFKKMWGGGEWDGASLCRGGWLICDRM